MQRIGSMDVAHRRGELSGEQPQQSVFAAAVGSDKANTHAGGKDEVEILEEGSAADIEGDVIQLDQPPGLSVSGGKIDTGAGCTGARGQVSQFPNELLRFVDASFGLRSACLGSALQPLDLAVYSIFQRFLVFGLGMKERFFLLQKPAVIASDP